LGPNGAGESTTIEMFTTLLLPTEGLLNLDGHDVLSVVAKFDLLSCSINSLRHLLSNINNFGTGLDMLVLSIIIILVFLGLGSYFFSKIQI
jgi:ABC-type enterochelin transport system ATPase subunit